MILPREQQCVSCKTARRMKELGFRQDMEWYWVSFQCGSSNGKPFFKLINDICNINEKTERYAAYTTSELGVILKCNSFVTFFKQPDVRIEFSFNKFEADTEAEARGLLACHLKEQGLL